jgi:hypothetical protein
MIHRDFQDALADWRESGGAINYLSATSDEPQGWEVVGGVELAERITCTVRQACVLALEAGGMTEGQITTEMRDFVDG